MPPEFLTASQIAALLRVNERTLLRWRRDGDGPPYIRAGKRRILYLHDDMVTWAAERRFAHRAAEACGANP